MDFPDALLSAYRLAGRRTKKPTSGRPKIGNKRSAEKIGANHQFVFPNTRISAGVKKQSQDQLRPPDPRVQFGGKTSGTSFASLVSE